MRVIGRDVRRGKKLFIKYYNKITIEMTIIFRFPTKSSLNQHNDIHKGFKRYACDWPGCQSYSI
jgi:hypothetical protein